jgi:hypothetical protein
MTDPIALPVTRSSTNLFTEGDEVTETETTWTVEQREAYWAEVERLREEMITVAIDAQRADPRSHYADPEPE